MQVTIAEESVSRRKEHIYGSEFVAGLVGI